MNDLPNHGKVDSQAGCVYAIGLRFDRISAEVRAACVAYPPVLHLQAPSVEAVDFDSLSSDLLTRWQSAELSETTFDQREQLTQDINDIAERLVQNVLADIGDTDEDVLAIGCHGSGIWNVHDVQHRGHVELISSNRLAESFGKTVVCDFPARDLVRGGSGGPVESFGLGILLTDRSHSLVHPGHRWRGLLDLAEHATHFTMIPPLHDRSRREASFSYDIAPGYRLLAELAARDASTTQRDEYDKLAATGRVIRELVEIWNATTTSGIGFSWSPGGVNVLPLMYALEQSNHRSAAIADLLATATSFLTQQIGDFVLHHVSPAHPVGELLIMGGGVKNPLLLRQLSERLPTMPMLRLDALGQNRTLLAASVATLAMANLWQIPMPPTQGYEVPRVLGSITPGCPSNWQRVLHEMSGSAPWLLPLREAV